MFLFVFDSLYASLCKSTSMFVGRRMFDNIKTKALHIKSLFLQYGELQNIHWLINLYFTMCDNEGIGNINQFLIAIFFFLLRL